MPSHKPHEVWKDSAKLSLRKAVENNCFEIATWPRGAMFAPHSWRAKYAANCSSPVIVHKTGRRLTRKGKSVHTVTVNPETHPLLVEYEVPCRKCENCLRRRAHHWRLRALSEIRAAPLRTWFGSLTLSPEQHDRVLNACRHVANQNGDDFDTFSAESQFKARHACISREITLYAKRLRKQTGVELRFLCVAEAHKNGLPHYHMLVHEQTGTIPHAVLKQQWRVGFSHWKLVKDPRAAGYVTKYLAKSSLARVRASLDYGTTSSDIVLKERETPRPPQQPTCFGTDLEGATTDW